MTTISLISNRLYRSDEHFWAVQGHMSAGQDTRHLMQRGTLSDWQAYLEGLRAPWCSRWHRRLARRTFERWQRQQAR